MAIELSVIKKMKDFKLEISFTKGMERLGILGASGSGKSLMLKILAGVEVPDCGRIVLNNRILYDSEQNINVLSRYRKVGYLFQNYALFPHLTVEQNIEIGIPHHKNKQDVIAQQIAQFQLIGLEKRYPNQLSGGQQQRVALARIMANDPEAILLDEPFSALDSYLKENLCEQLQELMKNYEKDVVIVSHNMDEIYQFCDRLVVIEKGSSIMSEDTQKLFQQPRRVEAARMTGCNNISRIRRLDTHCLEALDWGLTLYTKHMIKGDITHVGIRAQHLKPAYEKKDNNCISIKLINAAESLFQMQFTVCQQKALEQDPMRNLRWHVGKEELKYKYKDKIPPYLYLPPEQLMLLVN